MTPQSYTHSQVEKLGNAIIFLSENMGKLSKTKLLKLLYLIEEVSVKKYGMPFFHVNFELWRLGPVVKDVFIELSSQLSLLHPYIVTQEVDGGTYVTARKPFCDDEFSDLELDTLRLVAGQFRHTSAEKLVEITHRENHPWWVAARKHGVLEAFENNELTSTDEVIDMSVLLNDDAAKKQFYLSNLAYLEQSHQLKKPC